MKAFLICLLIACVIRLFAGCMAVTGTIEYSDRKTGVSAGITAGSSQLPPKRGLQK